MVLNDVEQVNLLDKVLTMVLKVVVIPTVNSEYIMKPIVIYFTVRETVLFFLISEMLLPAYLKQGYPLPAIGKMNLLNTQLQVLKV